LFVRCLSLEKDFYVIGLMHRDDLEETKTEKVQKQQGVRVCYSCSDEAWKSCNRCDKIICDSCFELTHRFNVFDDHQLVVSSSSSQNLFQRLYQEKFCPQHDGEGLTFCHDCQKIFCLSCDCACSSHNICSVESEVIVVKLT
jgi:hypothetical protein